MIYFVVPAFNEEKNIETLIHETHNFISSLKQEYRLIIVDDGSYDLTAQIVKDNSRRYSCEVVSYHPNQGVGEAFRQGLKRALTLASKKDLIVTKEADGTSDLAILPALIHKIDSGCDVALASCYARGGRIEGIRFLRLFLSRSANFLIQILFNIHNVHTYSSFYRVYRPSALHKALARYGDFYDEKGFACVIELLVRLSKLGMRIEEVPMVLVSGRRVGKSKMKVWRTTLGYFRVIGRNLFC